MRLTSPQFEQGGAIPAPYTCDGKGISPPFEIHDVPEGTKSLALVMDDPDAMKPAGRVWDHWVAWNIPPETRSIPEGEDPSGVMGVDTRGNRTYGCPAPPDGMHRYYFRLYALDVLLDLPAGSTKAELLSAMKRHLLATAELMGTYVRQSR